MNGTRQHEEHQAVLLPGGIEFARALAAHNVRLTAVYQGSSGYLGSSNVVERVLIGPAEWGTEMGRWLDMQHLPEGSAVLPGNDGAAWWLANHHGCQRSLRYATPGLEAIRALLVKRHLYDLCLAHGVAAPKTWLAREGDSLPRGPFPLMVKPQTRVGMQHWVRGLLARNASELTDAIDWFRRSVSFSSDVAALEPEVAIPLVQEYVVRPRHEVYHLAGYRSRAGESVFAAHRKILQYPLRFGSGLCFASAPVDQQLANGLERLLAAAGYHGIFEAEYVEREGEKLLIDLNPRSYNGISLETRRGYALPWYLYLDTVGEHHRLSQELARARSLNPPDMVWRDSIRFWTTLAGQSLSGGMSLREARQWVGWSRDNRHRLIDPHFTREDPRAGLAALRQHLVSAVRQPRAFLGTYVRRGLDR